MVSFRVLLFILMACYGPAVAQHLYFDEARAAIIGPYLPQSCPTGSAMSGVDRRGRIVCSTMATAIGFLGGAHDDGTVYPHACMPYAERCNFSGGTGGSFWRAPESMVIDKLYVRIENDPGGPGDEWRPHIYVDGVATGLGWPLAPAITGTPSPPSACGPGGFETCELTQCYCVLAGQRLWLQMDENFDPGPGNTGTVRWSVRTRTFPPDVIGTFACPGPLSPCP